MFSTGTGFAFMSSVRADKSLMKKGVEALAEGRLPYRVARWFDRSTHIKLATQSIFNLVYATPPVATHPDADVECITLLDRGNLTSYLIAIKSFLHFSRQPAKVTVLSDGSLGEDAIRVLEQHLPDLRVIVPGTSWMKPFRARAELQQLRARFVLTRKLLDLPYGDLKPSLVFLDSDVVFRRPVDAEFFAHGDAAFRYNRDHDHRVYDKLFHHAVHFMQRRGIPPVATDVNSGLMCVRTSAIQPEVIEEFFCYLLDRDAAHDLMEQDCYNVLAALGGCRPLSDQYWVGCNPDHWGRTDVAQGAIAKHYVSGVRYRTFGYARDFLSILPALRGSSASARGALQREAA